MTAYAQPTLSRAVSDYLLSLRTDRRGTVWPELAAFARWYGGERPVRDLTPTGVSHYLQQSSVGEDPQRLEQLRAFFAYLEGLSLVGEPVTAALRASKNEEARAAPPAAATQATESMGEGTRSRCPACGEEEALRGRRRSERIAITCERCGHAWERSLQRSCPWCGRADLVPTREELREKVRGTQVAVVGIQTVYRCPSCDA